jgi:hypothetical protein
MSTLAEIAQQLKKSKENIILVYAFNSTGKTQLSVTYKNVTKAANGGKHSGVYYNAFSEDLFVWDNDNIKLTITPSSLNLFHNSFTELDIYKKLTPYKPRYEFYFNPNKDAAKGFDSIVFYKKDDKNIPIKISRGEERIFIWCFFLTLFDVEAWSGEQNAHFFIDDPVSSLDDHNIFVTASTIFELLENQLDKRKIILTSHHLGIISILDDWLNKGEKKDKFRSKNKVYILERDEEEHSLINPRNCVLLYHLRLLQLLDSAFKSEIYSYHFALLRQVLENIASFLGVGQFSYVLEQIGITPEQRVTDIVNALSHKKVYYFESDLLVDDNKTIFKEVYSKLIQKYNFVIHTD